MGMLGPSAISCWGIAPGKQSVQPEVLGLGFGKFIVSGFTCMVMVNMPKMLEVVNRSPGVVKENGFTSPPFKQGALQDIIKSLTVAQVEVFQELMGDGICKCTTGAGDLVVCPQGQAAHIL